MTDPLSSIVTASVPVTGGADEDLPRVSTARSSGGADGPSTSDLAKMELDHRVALYQFHVSSYIRGVAFFLVINGVLFKFAIDDARNRDLYSMLALLCGAAITIPLIYSFWHIRAMKVEFQRLATLTSTTALSVSPLLMLSVVTTAFWFIIVGAWIYLRLFR